MTTHRDRGPRERPELAHPALGAAEIQDLVMNVTAEGVCGVGGVGATLGSRRTVDIVPAFRRCRRGVSVADRSLAHDKRQRRQEASLLLAKRLSCPFDRGARRVVEIAAALFDGFVVVTLENHRTLPAVPGG